MKNILNMIFLFLRFLFTHNFLGIYVSPKMSAASSPELDHV